MRLGEAVAGLVAKAVGLQPVGEAVVSRGGVHRAASGEQNRLSNAHRALMGEQDLPRSSGIAEVLVDVDNRLVARAFLGGLASWHHRRQRQERGSSQEVAAREAGGLRVESHGLRVN